MPVFRYAVQPFQELPRLIPLPIPPITFNLEVRRVGHHGIHHPVRYLGQYLLTVPVQYHNGVFVGGKFKQCYTVGAGIGAKSGGTVTERTANQPKLPSSFFMRFSDTTNHP